MLCYRFMLSKTSSSSYLKLYDAEIVPLLLRRPLTSTSLCGNNIHSSATEQISKQKQRQEHEFIRSSSRTLFRELHLSTNSLKDKALPGSTTSKSSTPPAAASTADKNEIPDVEVIPEKLGLFARFKKMYREYWYVLLPVHVVTSAGWLGGFYYLSKSGVDVASIMESWHFNDLIVGHLRDSKLGHVAIAYILYKCATPLRYMVTLGGTTLAIKNLSRLGYIRPVPSKSALIQMYHDKKDSAKQAIHKKTHGGSNSI